MVKSYPPRVNILKLLLIIIAIFLIITLGVFIFLQKNVKRSDAGENTQAILKHISTVIELPDEKPIIAIVSNKTKLTNKEFFANADIGDILLIFPNAKKAFLYRPSIEKIIEFGPLLLSQPSPTPKNADLFLTQ